MSASIFPPREPLHGWRLQMARTLAFVIAIGCLLLFTIALPSRAESLADTSLRSLGVLESAGVNEPGFLSELIKALPVYGLLVEVTVMLMFYVVSMILFWKRSDDWLVLITVAGLSAFALHITPTLNAWMLANPGAAWIGHLMKGAGIGFALFFLYLFPSGYYVPGGMRLLMFAWLVWMALWLLFPDSIFGFRDPYSISIPGFILLLAWWSTGIGSQLYRHLRVSGPLEKQQTKFISFSATLALLGYVVYVPLRELMASLPQPELALSIYQAVAPYVYLALVSLVPVTIAFSILRYRLWDIDFIIRRTISYAALTTLLAAIYVFAVLLLQFLVFGWLSRLPEIFLALATLVVALLINPIRTRLQRSIDRRYFRGKYDLEKTIAEFNQSINPLRDPEELQERLVRVVQDTMQPEILGFWLPGDRKKE